MTRYDIALNKPVPDTPPVTALEDVKVNEPELTTSIKLLRPKTGDMLFVQLQSPVPAIMLHEIYHIKDEYRQIIIKENLNLIPGNHVVIIDDMIRKGDTLDNCRLAVEDQGASAVSAYVTHGIFPEDSWTRFFDKFKLYKSNFTNLWITDSCAMSRKLQAICQKLQADLKGAELAPKILSLSSLIAEEIAKA